MYDEAGQLKKSTIQGKINNVDQKLETVMVAGMEVRSPVTATPMTTTETGSLSVNLATEELPKGRITPTMH